MLKIAILAIIGIIAVIFEVCRLRHDFRRRACQAVALSRCIMIATAILFLWQPTTTTRKPVTEKLKLAVAVDVSASMDVKISAEHNRTRLQQAEDVLNLPDFQSFLNSSGRVDFYAFTTDVVPLHRTASHSFSLASAPGNTCLGNTLATLLKHSRQGTPLAAVIIASDGRFNDGVNPLELAKQFRQQNIPVSTIVFAGDRRQSDISIKALQKNAKALKNTELHLQADVISSYTALQSVPVDLLINGSVVATQSVAVDASAPVTVDFTTAIPVAGFHSAAFRAHPPKDDARDDNNTDFIAVEITEPPSFKCLYLSSVLDWEWKFFVINADSNEQIDASAIIRMGTAIDEGQFFRRNLPAGFEDLKNGFPETPELYESFAVIIVDDGLFPLLNDKQLNAIRAFVEYKGGGLLIRKSTPSMTQPQTAPDSVLAKFSQLLPAKSFKTVAIRQPVRVEFLRDLVYKHDSAKILEAAPGVRIQPPATVVAIDETRKSTRVIAALDSPDSATVMAVHAFGAGRVAFLGIADTWNWRLNPDIPEVIHETIWNHLIVWLAETGKPAMKIRGNGSKIPAGEPFTLTADVLGDDFKPAVDAKVSAVITHPDGTQSPLELLPSLDETGVYAADFIPPKSGEYRLDCTAESASRTISDHAVIIASLTGKEADDTSANESLLQDIARITGGTYFTPEQFTEHFRNLPISQDVPTIEHVSPVFPPWLLFTVFAIAAAAAWYIRRRCGLK